MRLVVLAAGLLSASAACAQTVAPRPVNCPEGRQADGSCVNPVLAVLARQQAVCFTQIKLSYIACPGTLPGLDYRYKYPHTVVTERQGEIDLLYNRRPNAVFGTTRTTVPVVTVTPATVVPATVTPTTVTTRTVP